MNHKVRVAEVIYFATVALMIVAVLTLSSVLAGCTSAPKLTPHYLDTQLMEMREYEVTDKKALKIKYKKAHRITPGKNAYGNGFFCIPGDQAGKWRNYCLQNECTEEGFVKWAQARADQNMSVMSSEPPEEWKDDSEPALE